MDSAEHDVDPRGERRSHRREGKAHLSMPPGSFGEEVAAAPRQVLFVAVGGLLGVTWGVTTLANDGPVWQRGLGLVGALAGALTWISYFIRFHPVLIAGERWTRTPARRAFRAVLAHAWSAFFVAAVLAWLISVASK